MGKPTNQQIIDVHEALLAELRDRSRDRVGLTAEAQRDAILKVLSSTTKITMADTEWDDNKHYLAEAEHPEYGAVIMLGVGPCSGDIRIMRDKERGALWQVVDPSELIPTGRKFELKEKNNG